MFSVENKGRVNISNSVAVIKDEGEPNDVWHIVANSPVIASFQGLHLCAHG
jgi:hypothetical protein